MNGISSARYGTMKTFDTVNIMNEKTNPTTEDVEDFSRHPSSTIDRESLHTNEAAHEKEAKHHEPDLESQRQSLHRVRSHVSTHDAVAVHDEGYEEGDEVYDKFTPRRKTMIVAVLSFCSFLAPMSSTSILAASPEVCISILVGNLLMRVS